MTITRVFVLHHLEVVLRFTVFGTIVLFSLVSNQVTTALQRQSQKNLKSVLCVLFSGLGGAFSFYTLGDVIIQR